MNKIIKHALTGLLIANSGLYANATKTVSSSTDSTKKTIPAKQVIRTKKDVSSLDGLVSEFFGLNLGTSTQDLIPYKFTLIQQILTNGPASIAQTVRYMSLVSKKSSALRGFNIEKLQTELLKIQAFFEEYILFYSNKELIEKNPDAYIMDLLGRMLHISNYTVGYLSGLVKSNFKNIPLFDFHTYAKKSAQPKVTVESIKTTILAAKELEASMNNFGLTKANRFFRWSQDTIIDPARRFLFQYPIHKTACATALFGTYLLWKGGKLDAPFGEFPKLIPNFSITETGGIKANEFLVANADKLKLPGKLQLWLQKIAADQYATMFGGLALTQALVMFSNSKTTISQKVQQWYNSLRGFLHEEQGVQGLFAFNPHHTMDDVIGCESIKNRMQLIVKAMENPTAFAASSERRLLAYLFTGESRSGKTFMAEAICGSIQRVNPACKFLMVEYQDIMQMGIDGIVAYAKYFAPAVIIIDEAHLLQLQTTGDKKVLRQFLSSIGNTSDFDATKPVAFLVLTNEEEHLATPLKNRFDIMRFEYPTLEERVIFLAKEFSKFALDPARFDIKGLAEKTEGKTFAQLSKLVSNAINKAWIQGSLVTQSLFDDALNSITRNVIVDSYLSINDPQILQEVATYFAGQAVMTTVSKTNRPLDMVTINKIQHPIDEIPANVQKSKEYASAADEYGYVFRKNTNETRGVQTMQEIENEIKVLLAGRVALRIIQGKDNYLLHKDNDTKAFDLVKKVSTPAFNSDSSELKNKVDAQAHAKYLEYEKEVESILLQNKERLALVAKLLARAGILESQHVTADLEQLAEAVASIEKQATA